VCVWCVCVCVCGVCGVCGVCVCVWCVCVCVCVCGVCVCGVCGVCVCVCVCGDFLSLSLSLSLSRWINIYVKHMLPRCINARIAYEKQMIHHGNKNSNIIMNLYILTENHPTSFIVKCFCNLS